jgi:hypothetical protein
VADSEELLDVFMGKSQKGRNELILEATSRTALRDGNWIMVPPYKGPAVNNQVNIELGNSPEFLLYNLETDVGQQKNLADINPKKLKKMVKTFEKIRGKEFGDIQDLELK